MIDIIWNLTKICPWNCEFCCMSSICTNKDNKEIVKNKLQTKKEELNYNEKLAILKDLTKNNCSIDFSGGDPIWCNDDLKIIEESTKLLPKEKISVSISGRYLDNKKLKILKKVGCVELTVDGLEEDNLTRPKGFNKASINSLKKLKNQNIKVKAITVLHRNNIKINKLKQIYLLLNKLKIPEWELLRFYNVGRAINMKRKTPTIKEYKNILKKLEILKGFTKIMFQHSLKTIMKPIDCPAGKISFGILPNGNVIACPWGLNQITKPLHDIFNLGKMPKEKLKDIINKDKVKIWKAGTKYCKTCKFISYRFKNIKNPEICILKKNEYNEN